MPLWAVIETSGAWIIWFFMASAFRAPGSGEASKVRGWRGGVPYSSSSAPAGMLASVITLMPDSPLIKSNTSDGSGDNEWDMGS